VRWLDGQRISVGLGVAVLLPRRQSAPRAYCDSRDPGRCELSASDNTGHYTEHRAQSLNRRGPRMGHRTLRSDV
jgi:hypothetical protein